MRNISHLLIRPTIIYLSHPIQYPAKLGETQYPVYHPVAPFIRSGSKLCLPHLPYWEHWLIHNVSHNISFLIISSWSFWWLFQVWDPRSCCQSCLQSEGVSRHGAPNPIVSLVVCFLSACHRLDNYHYHDLHQLIVRCCTHCPSSRGWLASPRPWATCSSCFRCPKNYHEINYCTSKYVILSHERCPTILLIDWLSDRIPSKQTPTQS